MKKSLVTMSGATATVLSVLALSACGGASSSADAGSTTTPAPASTSIAAPASTGQAKHETATSDAVGVSLGGGKEFSIAPAVASTAPGAVTFHVRNDGSVTHEMVVVRTDRKAGDLASGGARADESGSAGETGDMAAGARKTLTLKLPAGHYVLLCNLPGHYAGGMYTDFTVG